MLLCRFSSYTVACHLLISLTREVLDELDCDSQSFIQEVKEHHLKVSADVRCSFLIHRSSYDSEFTHSQHSLKEYQRFNIKFRWSNMKLLYDADMKLCTKYKDCMTHDMNLISAFYKVYIKTYCKACMKLVMTRIMKLTERMIWSFLLCM